jgi:hypothetical protein
VPIGPPRGSKVRLPNFPSRRTGTATRPRARSLHAGEAHVCVVRQRLERGKDRHLAIGPSVGVAAPARLPKPNDKSKMDPSRIEC